MNVFPSFSRVQDPRGIITASTDDEGDRFSKNPQTLYESLEAGIWFKYGMTSTRCRIALSHTARTNIQTIIRVSGQQMVGEEYSNMYTAILKFLVRAYHRVRERITFKEISWKYAKDNPNLISIFNCKICWTIFWLFSPYWEEKYGVNILNKGW